MFSVRKTISITLIIMMVVISSSFVFPKQTKAVGGVWIDTSFDFHSIVDSQKNFIWDRLATLFAKQLLHQMTVSVVNWINSGFEGSPAFLTNPTGFFLDTADQLTGQFIREGGPLSALCSPLSIDLRLSLALNQTMSASKRYTCTLGAMVNNVNGTIEGFTGGDFSQGGWPGFISLTTEPQNNVYGSYLQANSELLHLIGMKENSISQDLDRGSGFLSDKKCTEISETHDLELGESYGLDDSKIAQLKSTGKVSTDSDSQWKGASIEVKTNRKSGDSTYQRCVTTTPGSVISGLLGKQLSGPATELELADSINSVVNALISQMVTQVMSGGLSNLSSGGSGGRTAYTAQIITDINAEKNREYGSAETQIATIYTPAITALNEYKTFYDRAVVAITESKSRYETAKSCLAVKAEDTKYKNSERNYAKDFWIQNINNTLTSKVNPLLSQLIVKQSEAATKIAQIENSKTQLSVTGNIQNQVAGSQTTVQAAIDAKTSAISGTSAAQKDLEAAQTQAQTFNENAGQYQSACARFPDSVPFSYR